jgi:hypothetical protein
MDRRKVISLPRNTPAVLHEEAAIMSFENCSQLGKIYKEVIGLRNIDHFSLNVVDQNGKMAILSYNPQIAYNIFKDGSYRYNGSISPDYYNNRDLYTWDEAYDPAFYHQLKNTMEKKNGIEIGIVLVKKIGEITLLYSFATKKDPYEFFIDLQENQNFFYSIGDHCFSLIAPIVKKYIICKELSNPSNVIQLFKNE